MLQPWNYYYIPVAVAVEQLRSRWVQQLITAFGSDCLLRFKAAEPILLPVILTIIERENVQRCICRDADCCYDGFLKCLSINLAEWCS